MLDGLLDVDSMCIVPLAFAELENLVPPAVTEDTVNGSNEHLSLGFDTRNSTLDSPVSML